MNKSLPLTLYQFHSYEKDSSTSLSDVVPVWRSRAGWKITVRSRARDTIDSDVRLLLERARRGARSRQRCLSVGDWGAGRSARQRHTVQLRRSGSRSARRRQSEARQQREPTSATWLRSASARCVLRDRCAERRKDEKTGDSVWRRTATGASSVERQQRRQHRDVEPETRSESRHLRFPLPR